MTTTTTTDQITADTTTAPAEKLTALEKAMQLKTAARKEELEMREKLAAIKRRDLYYKNEITALTPQVKLMELRMQYAKYTLEHYKYSIELNAIQKGQSTDGTAPEAPAAKQETYQVTVTAEDLLENPDLVTQGIRVGDVITINDPENASYEGTGND